MPRKIQAKRDRRTYRHRGKDRDGLDIRQSRVRLGFDQVTKKYNPHYLRLPYKIVLLPSPEGGCAVEVPELPGCLSQGLTREEALAMIEDANRCWLADALAHGDPIPEPKNEADYSGRILLRTTKSLHKTLVELAREEKVSLNQYINYQLTSGLKESK